MCKEIWIESYEIAKIDIAEELDIEIEKAEEILINRLNINPHYLDGYLYN